MKKLLLILLLYSFFSCNNTAEKMQQTNPISGWYDFPFTINSDSVDIYKSFSTKEKNGYYSVHTDYVNYKKNITLTTADLDAEILSNDSIIMKSIMPEDTDIREWFLPSTKYVKTGVPIFFKINNTWDSQIFFDKSRKINDELRILSLIVNPSDFFNYETGIYVQGIYADKNNPKKGNYSQKGNDWRKDVSIHFFENNGDLKFKTNARIKMQGHFSRAQPQKSFTLIFDEPFFTQLFREKLKFHQLVLRTPFTSAPHGESLLADSYLGELANDLGLDAMKSEPINLYLNGEYWGLYHLRDKINEFYLKEKYNISKKSIDIVKYNHAFDDLYESVHGSKNEWIELINYISENDLSKDKVYDYVCQKIDIFNLIDYLILETFFANKDWPSNNFKFWKSSEIDNKWRFIIYDLDATFRKDNMFSYLTSIKKTGNNRPTSTILFRKLFKNQTFKSEFESRYYILLNTHLHVDNLIQKLNKKASIIDNTIDYQVKRWGMPVSYRYWKKSIKRMRKYIKNREQVYNDHLNYFLKY